MDTRFLSNDESPQTVYLDIQVYIDDWAASIAGFSRPGETYALPLNI